MIEYILNESCMIGSHHPLLTLETILFLMKGCQEAMHPVPIIWLVCKSVRDLVHLLDRSLAQQIETTDYPELDFQQQGSGL